MFGNERKANKVSCVCEKEKEFFCPPKTALKDLLQRSINGFGWESKRPWPLLSFSKRKTKCWGGRNTKNPDPLETIIHTPYCWVNFGLTFSLLCWALISSSVSADFCNSLFHSSDFTLPQSLSPITLGALPHIIVISKWSAKSQWKTDFLKGAQRPICGVWFFFPCLIPCRSQPTSHTWVYLPSRSKLWPSGLTVIMLLYDLAKRSTPEHKQSFNYIWPSGRHHTCNKEKKNEINHCSDIKHLSLKYEGFKVDMVRK